MFLDLSTLVGPIPGRGWWGKERRRESLGPSWFEWWKFSSSSHIRKHCSAWLPSLPLAGHSAAATGHHRSYACFFPLGRQLHFCQWKSRFHAFDDFLLCICEFLKVVSKIFFSTISLNLWQKRGFRKCSVCHIKWKFANVLLYSDFEPILNHHFFSYAFQWFNKIYINKRSN